MLTAFQKAKPAPITLLVKPITFINRSWLLQNSMRHPKQRLYELKQAKKDVQTSTFSYAKQLVCAVCLMGDKFYNSHRTLLGLAMA
ncbi:hypothetical protein BXP70_28360 [Hymenobacter crusticola]|uniref:Uncharacterized protein n=1 Tax=Hymenobacter crusticola TaxID=1770526 RepID=A0A243W545_9BACT|nr:hypothetical protein BXP70_28360 [Hymenobacter crusticola]